MTQNSRQVKKVPPRSKVRYGKCVPQGMHGAPDPGYAKLLACELEIPMDITLGEFAALASAKDQVMLTLGEVPLEKLSQLNAHWYESMLIALSFDPQDEIVKVHIFARQAKQLTHAKTGVKGGKRGNSHSRVVTADGLPVYKLGHLRRRKRR